MRVKENSINYSLTAPAASDVRRWYAIYTKPAKEDCVVMHISRMGLEAFSPRIKQSRKVWGEQKEIIAPLFPCYAFAKFNDSSLYSIRYVRGVRRIVGVGEMPTPIEEHIITTIKLRIEGEREHATLPEVKPGDPVFINRGALYGLEGVFVEELSGKERVIILLHAIEWQARVQIEKSAVEKLASCRNRTNSLLVVPAKCRLG